MQLLHTIGGDARPLAAVVNKILAVEPNGRGCILIMQSARPSNDQLLYVMESYESLTKKLESLEP